MTDTTPYKFRASYSVLNFWYQKKTEDAVRCYFKLPGIETPQMLDGKRFHNEWQAETERTKCLPAVFGGAPLKNHVLEQKAKMVVQVYPWLEMVGVPDCVDYPAIHEYKSGTRPASYYIKTYQLGMYGILALASGHNVEVGWLHHFNQYTGRADSEGVWLSEQYLRETMAWVEHNASEMRDYILKNKLQERFGVLVSNTAQNT